MLDQDDPGKLLRELGLFRRLAQSEALRLCYQQKGRADEILGGLASGRSASGDYQRACCEDRFRSSQTATDPVRNGLYGAA